MGQFSRLIKLKLYIEHYTRIETMLKIGRCGMFHFDKSQLTATLTYVHIHFRILFSLLLIQNRSELWAEQTRWRNLLEF